MGRTTREAQFTCEDGPTSGNQNRSGLWIGPEFPWGVLDPVLRLKFEISGGTIYEGGKGRRQSPGDVKLQKEKLTTQVIVLVRELDDPWLEENPVQSSFEALAHGVLRRGIILSWTPCFHFKSRS